MEKNATVANLVSTQLEASDLLKMVAYSFGIGHRPEDKAGLLQALDRQLTWDQTGHRAVLIVDEAQGLNQSAMEELRLLTKLQVAGRPLLQIFLLGQPDLRDLILGPGMEQVHQRIVASANLGALQEDETEAYIATGSSGWAGWATRRSVSLYFR